MKPMSFSTVLAAFTITSFASSGCGSTIKADTTGFAVVELYTSEGCSSCPPADALVAKLLNTYKENVYVLGFHVDYWNYIGWKDNFSNAAYSLRQQQYKNVFQLNSVYTPQVVVNGTAQFVGSNEGRLRGAIEQNLKQPAAAIIHLTARNDGNNINVTYKINTSPVELNIALVQAHAETTVQRGENAGKFLQHTNVVRDFKTVDLKNSQSNINFILPNDLHANDCKVIAFLQDVNSLKIIGAAQVRIE